mmetsp:Transcript_7665/g.17907  ORF Transcript_7665/g.17907 Transcript_7665/m.17907 type:complete len:202 (-) Transcript_7665:1840-2445(-)
MHTSQVTPMILSSDNAKLLEDIINASVEGIGIELPGFLDISNLFTLTRSLLFQSVDLFCHRFPLILKTLDPLLRIINLGLDSGLSSLVDLTSTLDCNKISPPITNIKFQILYCGCTRTAAACIIKEVARDLIVKDFLVKFFDLLLECNLSGGKNLNMIVGIVCKVCQNVISNTDESVQNWEDVVFDGDIKVGILFSHTHPV